MIRRLWLWWKVDVWWDVKRALPGVLGLAVAILMTSCLYIAATLTGKLIRSVIEQ